MTGLNRRHPACKAGAMISLDFQEVSQMYAGIGLLAIFAFYLFLYLHLFSGVSPELPGNSGHVPDAALK